MWLSWDCYYAAIDLDNITNIQYKSPIEKVWILHTDENE